MKPHPDAKFRVRLLGPGQGGRDGPIISAWFGIVLIAEAGNFDVRLRLPAPLQLGETREVEADFLFPDRARGLLSVGDAFELWEGQVVGSGKILSMELVTLGV